MEPHVLTPRQGRGTYLVLMTRLRPITFVLGFAGFIRPQIFVAESAEAERKSNSAKADDAVCICLSDKLLNFIIF